jgi:hypothetical protein
MNPRIGSGLQHARAVEEEEVAEVVEDHAGDARRWLVATSPRERQRCRAHGKADSPT